MTCRRGISWAISILGKSFASERALAIILGDKLKEKNIWIYKIRAYFFRYPKL